MLKAEKAKETTDHGPIEKQKLGKQKAEIEKAKAETLKR